MKFLLAIVIACTTSITFAQSHEELQKEVIQLQNRIIQLEKENAKLKTPTDFNFMVWFDTIEDCEIFLKYLPKMEATFKEYESSDYNMPLIKDAIYTRNLKCSSWSNRLPVFNGRILINQNVIKNHRGW